jgi:hypothetical protein
VTPGVIALTGRGLKIMKSSLPSHPWFKVYPLGDSVYAIYEPYNWQEMISYLIIGSEKALLFDTGMGLDSRFSEDHNRNPGARQYVM